MNSSPPSATLYFRVSALLVLFLAGFAALPATSVAQESRAVPRRDYFLALGLYHEGEFGTALNGFRNAAKGGIRSTEGRWVDSICYHAMMGECFYQLGQNEAALERFNSALELMVVHRDWLLRVQFPPTIGPSARTPQNIRWATSTRRPVIGGFPDKMATLQGNPDVEGAIRNGGVIAPPELFPLHVEEIVRCVSLSLRRRMELMGPTCQHDLLTDQLLAAIGRRPAPPNHWSQSWISVLLGLTYVSDGKPVQAIAELQRGLVAAGEYDHALTGVALLELGKLAFQQGKLPTAGKYFLEATLSSAAFGQHDVTEEAFRWAARTHQVSGGEGVFAPLAGAASWATRNSRWLDISLTVAAAEQFANRQDPARATAMLTKARRNLFRSEMAGSRVGSRFHYVNALVSYQKGSAKSGDEAFAAATAIEQKASHRLFQIRLADGLFTSGAISQRIADELFEELLREPTERDWRTEPMETLTVAVTPQPLPMEHWFEVSLMRKQIEKAMLISDRLRRQRFFASQPMGGRLVALRWILEAPKEALNERALLQRRDLRIQFPRYAQLSQQAEQLRAELRQAGLVRNTADGHRDQGSKLDELAKLSVAQEMILREMALQPLGSERVFPPLLDPKTIQQQLPDGQVVLSFLSTQRFVYAFALNNSQLTHWRVDSPTQIRSETVNLLRQMGHHERNMPLAVKDLQSSQWKVPARQLLGKLTADAPAATWEQFDELVVVPDGILWYLPFEALILGDSPDALPLLARMRVRYAPTLGLTLPDGRGARPLGNAAIVAGRLFPRDREEVGVAASKQIQRVVPGSAILPETVPSATSLFAFLCDRLIVLQDLEDTDKGPLDWTPLPGGRGRLTDTLRFWLPLPWGGPDQIALPGFHTPAENALKRAGNGQEVFLALCSVMSTGTRTVLISRWRTGGQTCYDLLREYAQELPHARASRAWQRSVTLARDAEIDPEREPRVHPFAGDTSIKAAHPFFWAGYMLVDTGADP